MNNNNEDNLGMIFDSLANSTRRKIINTLAYSPTTPSKLAEEFNISLPGIHKHLQILEKSDLIRRQKTGRVNFVALNSGTLQFAQKWINQYQTYWGNRTQTLENYISTHQANLKPSKDG